MIDNDPKRIIFQVTILQFEVVDKYILLKVRSGNIDDGITPTFSTVHSTKFSVLNDNQTLYLNELITWKR